MPVIFQSQLASLLKTAEELRIKGLSDIRWNNKDEPPDCNTGQLFNILFIRGFQYSIKLCSVSTMRMSIIRCTKNVEISTFFLNVCNALFNIVSYFSGCIFQEQWPQLRLAMTKLHWKRNQRMIANVLIKSMLMVCLYYDKPSNSESL